MKHKCPRCKREVKPVEGYINHIHLGRVNALVCPLILKVTGQQCGSQVYVEG